jgi:hypothetical protein
VFRFRNAILVSCLGFGAVIVGPAGTSYADDVDASTLTLMSLEQAQAAGVDVSAVLNADTTVENDVYSVADGEADPVIDSAASSAPPPIDRGAWDEVLTHTTTWDGYYAPTRQGTERLAYQKACGYHNVCTFKIFNTAYQGFCKQPSGTRCVYIALVVDNNGNVKMSIRVIYDKSNTSQYGRTADGHAVGTINAYCVGYTRCPSWVNMVQAGVVLVAAGG